MLTDSIRALRIFITVAVGLGIFSAPVVAQDVPLYGLFETSIDYQSQTGQAQAYSDPFYGIDLVATFTHSASGRQVNWWGFYDGNGQGGQSGNIWKLRFMPDELGTWTYSWQMSDSSASGSGSFNAVDNASNPRKPGPLKHDNQIRQWAVTADGSRHVFLNMYTTPTSADNPSFWTNPQQTIDEATGYGFEVIAAWSTLYYPSGSNHIWQDTSGFVPNLSMIHTMEDGLYQRAYDQEIYIYEWDGFYSGNGLHNLHTKSTQLQDDVIRYWLAREAPYYMFMFNIGFELEEFVSVPAWPAARAQTVKQMDPWDHLITAHQGVTGTFEYANESVIDFSALQYYDYPNYNSNANAIWNAPSKPIGHISEGLWNGPWGSPGSDAQYRQAYWDLIVGGASYFYWPFENFTGLSAVENAQDFLRDPGVQWWTMSPNNGLVNSGNARVLANVGVEYIAYSASGSSFSMSIPSGSYTQRWFNPTSGDFQGQSALNSSGGSVSFSKPSSGDWVLHIFSGSNPPPPPPPNPPPAAPTNLTSE